MNNDNREIIVRVKEILCEVLNLVTIDDNAEQSMYSEWDSLAYLSILSALEDEFKITVNENNINKFNSITNIIKEIENGKHNN